jgi:hypothetical protein
MARGESIPVDSPRWQLEGQAKVTDHLGRKCLSLRGGNALLKDFEMRDAVIDVDIAAPVGRGFFGVYFRYRSDGSAEWVYLRPHKSGLDDAQQYVPIIKGDAPWQLYNGPGFTGAVDIPADVWFHLRLEVAGAQAKLFVNDMKQPSLVMTDLKSGNQKGNVLLAGPAFFSNFEVHETPPVTWERHLPAMPSDTLINWSLSSSFKASERNLERALSKSDSDAMHWEDVTAEPPGMVVINRYRDSPKMGTLEFEKRLEPQKEMLVVYARTTIVADRDEVRKLELGYSDDVSVFLNQRILYRGRSAQHFRDPGFLGIVNPENDAVYLPLKKGRNELVLAVGEITGGWGFICRLKAAETRVQP